jgi:homoserine acetyltransferase
MMPQTCPGSVISPCRVRSQRRLIALLVGLAVSVGVSLGAQAATTWTVCASGCDYTRIKSAIAASTTLDGDTLTIAAGTYTEPGIVVDKSLTFQGG